MGYRTHYGLPDSALTAVVALKFTADLTEYRFGTLDRPLQEAI